MYPPIYFNIDSTTWRLLPPPLYAGHARNQPEVYSRAAAVWAGHTYSL